MIQITHNAAYDNECNYISMLITYTRFMKNTPILPKYFIDEKNQKLFKCMVDCYNKYGIIDHYRMYEMHDKMFDSIIAHYSDLMSDTPIFKDDLEKQKENYENIIIENYKNKIITDKTKELASGIISNTDFLNVMEKLKSIQIIVPENSMINVNDVDMSKDEEPIRIKSNTVLLDSYIKGFALGQLSVWSGGNASGKSSYLNQIAIESIEQGFKVAIYSGELTAKRLLGWILMQCAGKRNMSMNYEKNYWFVNSNAKEKILKWLNGKLFIYDNNKGNKSDNVVKSIKKCIKENGVKTIIIDNLMSIDIGNDNKYDQQSKFIQDLSALAKEMNVHIHFVCHPRKVTNFLRKNDISGTADLTNIADNVFITHRNNVDFEKKTFELFGWKKPKEEDLANSESIFKYSNMVEICKNRDFGVEDKFAGMFYDMVSRRLKDYENEDRHYGWEKII